MPDFSTCLRRWLTGAMLVVLAGCQAPTVATPTPVPQPAPTVPAVPVPPSVAPTAAPIAPPVGTSRVETLNAANTAFNGRDLKSAASLYDRVINTPPAAGEAAATTAAIDDFARFRAMVTLLADGRDDEAHARLDELQKRDPTGPLARLGSQLYDQYGMTGQLRGACAQIQPQIATQAAPTLTALQALGVNVDANTLCSPSP